MRIRPEPKSQIRIVATATRPAATVAALVLADLFALIAAGVLAVILRGVFDQGFNHSLYYSLWPAMVLFIAVYFIVGLYPGVGLAPAEELRRLTLATTLVYLVLAAGTFLFKEGNAYSRAVFLGAWVLSVVLVPLARALVRHMLAHRPWWGYPVVVLGAGKTGRMVVQALRRNPGLGFKPVAVLDDNPDKHGSLEGVPVVGSMELAPALAAELHVRHAIVAMPGVPRQELLSILERRGGLFPHIVVIPDLFGFSSLWVSVTDMGGVLGLELRQRLLLPGPRLLKRAIDLTSALLGGLLISPLLLLIAIWIKLDSRGPVFYGHMRIGQEGRRFKAWKFRSMIPDADSVLQDYLERHPEFQAEWEATQKLKNDPRVTRVGRWLRKFSLDELPQLWNVIRGEMSLVGPRPIVQEELAKYGEKGVLYLKVKPGMTGLWQVSGRSETSYQERVEIDAYYVRNWSVWLDLYILARTVWVVLFGRGAY